MASLAQPCWHHQLTLDPFGMNSCSSGSLGVQEAQHLEWVDDVLLFMRKGPSSPRAYQMAAPLLADIAASLKVRLHVG